MSPKENHSCTSYSQKMTWDNESMVFIPQNFWLTTRNIWNKAVGYYSCSTRTFWGLKITILMEDSSRLPQWKGCDPALIPGLPPCMAALHERCSVPFDVICYQCLNLSPFTFNFSGYFCRFVQSVRSVNCSLWSVTVRQYWTWLFMIILRNCDLCYSRALSRCIYQCPLSFSGYRQREM